MNWDDLRFFLELTRLKRLNLVGRKLDVDHTTVARRIEQLETALGCRLFESTPEGYLPTEAGQRLLRHGRRASASMRAAEADLEALAKGEAGTLRVGTFQSAGVRLLPGAMRRLRHPDRALSLYVPSGRRDRVEQPVRARPAPEGGLLRGYPRQGHLQHR